MAEEEAKKVEEQAANQEQEKTVIPLPEETSKAIVAVETPAPVPEKNKSYGGSIDRDIVLTKVAEDKKLALIKAWEDAEKNKAENKAIKKLSAVEFWENSQKASIEFQLRKIEEKLEKMKAEAAEKMKNKVAQTHKTAEEKRAMVEAKKGEQLLKAAECAAKFRATGKTPKKMLGCFSY